MSYALSGRHFLKLLDFTSEEIVGLVDLAQDLKEKKHAGIPHRYLEGKNMVLIFEKTSTRTRCSFEVAGHDLGIGCYLSRFIRFADRQQGIDQGYCARTRAHVRWHRISRLWARDRRNARGVFWRACVERSYRRIPSYADDSLDLLTIRENFGDFQGLNLVFMGDAKNNVANSLMVASAKMGINFTACGPAECMPNDELVAICRAIAAENNCEIRLTSDVEEGCTGANIIYTDIWVSMGEPASLWEERIRLLSPYQVNAKVMAMAADNAIFLHCLPAFHDTDTSVAQDIEARFRPYRDGSDR